MRFTATARSLGILSATATTFMLVAYAVTLAVGLASLESPEEPIGDPMFTMLEVLIVVTMPAMVALMVDVHAWAPMQAKTLSLTSLVLMGLLAGLTCVVPFSILTLSRQPEFAGRPWSSRSSGPRSRTRWISSLGIVGYVGVFFVVAALLAVLFYRTTPQES